MRGKRDQHPRLRDDKGRLSAVQAISQDLMLAKIELDHAVNATELKAIGEHVTLARRLLADAIKKLERIK